MSTTKINIFFTTRNKQHRRT